MPGPLRLLAGDCTVTFDDADDTRRERGNVLVVAKPDDTVLVHDARGYRPVAWLTRAEAVTCSRASPPTVLAQDGDRRLHVRANEDAEFTRVPASHAGTPVGDCPDCAAPLVRARGGVACLDCDREHGLPGGATVLDERCDCGLPRLRVERGAAFEVCLDRTCDPLDDRVRERFDGEWVCPDCGGALRVLRRGGLIAGCEHYPDCETGFAVPRGVVEGTCDCGLPVFETAGGRRCLDANCEAAGG